MRVVTAANQSKVEITHAAGASVVRVTGVIDGAPAKKQPFRVNKLVEDDLTILWLRGALDKTARLKRHADGLEGNVLVIMEAVDATTPDGLTNLRELIRGPAASVFLSLVPMSVARAFVAYPELLGKGSLLSCVVHTRCLGCGTQEAIEVRGGATMPPPDAATCSKCGKAQRQLPWSADDAATLKAVTFAPVPAEIEAFMKARTDWQNHTSVAGQGATPKTEELLRMGATVGSRIAGKYEVIRRIGFGGMAEVLLGRQLGVEGFEKKVVIKKILPHLAEQASFVRMFLEEARIAARLQHGNIVQVYDLLHEGNEFYAILEFVRGGDLNVMLKISTALGESIPIEIACRIVCDVSDALLAAHSYRDDMGVHKPIFHRDVSPHNVLLSMEGAVKLSDFGIAKAADSLADDTGTGVLKGKVVYMPPEAIMGQGADHRADVYAATVVLYQCLAGKNPFNRATQALSLRAVIDEAVPQIDTVRPDVPRALVAIINKGMHRDPTQRYQSAADLGADLEDFLISFGKQSSSSRVGTWVKDLLTRGHELAGGSATNTPSPSSPRTPSEPSSQSSSDVDGLGGDTLMTSLTTPARMEHRDLAQEWFEDLELKPR